MKRIAMQYEDFSRLFKAMKDEIIKANSYHRLYCDLLAAMPDHQREFDQSKVFWYLTLEALQDARRISLCRVYDQQRDGLNLLNLLHIIKTNLRVFSEEEFRKRLQGNAVVDSSLKARPIPQKAEIDRDIESVSCQNPEVKKLMIWRGNIVAHHGATISLGKNQILEKNPLSPEEINKLLNHCFEIFNKYSFLYNVLPHSANLPILGSDDYKSLLKFIGLGLKKCDENKHKTFGQPF